VASLTDRYRAAQFFPTRMHNKPDEFKDYGRSGGAAMRRWIADWWQYLAHERQWPLITQRRARQQERNAFELGVDAGRSGNVRAEES
jgi:hypothetical protein